MKASAQALLKVEMGGLDPHLCLKQACMGLRGMVIFCIWSSLLVLVASREAANLGSLECHPLMEGSLPALAPPGVVLVCWGCGLWSVGIFIAL